MSAEPEDGAARCVTVPAPAKINLFLHIVGRREDRMHELQSLFAFADMSDEIQLRTGEPLALEISGPFATALTEACPRSDDNIVLKAIRGYARALGRTDPEIAVKLIKRLPVEAGIGGGSSDAAAVLRGLAGLWDGSVGEGQLIKVAVSLGADVPACLDFRPKLVEGIGERMTPVENFNGFPILLANPGVGLSTARVFAAYAASRPAFSEKLDLSIFRRLGPNAFMSLARQTRNDLEPAAIGQCPEISQILRELTKLPGCLAARMSGSGATCFALFEKDAEVEQLAQQLGDKHSGWWVKAGRLIASDT